MKTFIHKCLIAVSLAVFALGLASTSAQAHVYRPGATKTATPTVTLAQANEVFREMARQEDIAFRYVDDGCYARAYLMIDRMRAKGLEPVRVWTFQNGEALHVKTDLKPAGYVEWWYHVAPALPVVSGGRTVYLVIDPSMFSRPVTLEEWVKAQRRSNVSPEPLVQVTRLGQGPVNPKTGRVEGTGYGPFADPANPMAAALATMREYKTKEPPLGYTTFASR